MPIQSTLSSSVDSGNTPAINASEQAFQKVTAIQAQPNPALCDLQIELHNHIARVALVAKSVIDSGHGPFIEKYTDYLTGIINHFEAQLQEMVHAIKLADAPSIHADLQGELDSTGNHLFQQAWRTIVTNLVDPTVIAIAARLPNPNIEAKDLLKIAYPSTSPVSEYYSSLKQVASLLKISEPYLPDKSITLGQSELASGTPSPIQAQIDALRSDLGKPSWARTTSIVGRIRSFCRRPSAEFFQSAPSPTDSANTVRDAKPSKHPVPPSSTPPHP